MPDLVMRYLCRCLSCHRSASVAEADLERETTTCGACGDVLGIDGAYHPEHPRAVDFAIPPPPYASPVEVMQREASLRVASALPSRPTPHLVTTRTVTTTKVNGHHGTNGHAVAEVSGNVIVLKGAAAVPAAVATLAPVPKCPVCYDHGVLILADGTNAKKVPCPSCKVTT